MVDADAADEVQQTAAQAGIPSYRIGEIRKGSGAPVEIV
jgi:hypothetical protein